MEHTGAIDVRKRSRGAGVQNLGNLRTVGASIRLPDITYPQND